MRATRLIGLAFLLLTIDAHGADTSATTTAPASQAQKPVTGKERLSDKASDQQRVNDCRVPVEKRDPNHRRADCTRSR